MQNARRVHLIGISGTGMGSFAGLLKAAGHTVRGSDENVYPPMSDKLAAWGIEVRLGYRAENLVPAPDLIVVGNVIRRVNPEAQAALASGIPYASFPSALSDLFLAGRHSVVVAGTHGKTTTTSLIAWLLTHAGRDPGMLVGGVPQNFGEGFRRGSGEHFVVEGDEYDTAFFDKVPKFLHYRPRSLIATSLEFDHADIYPNVEAIQAEFAKLFALLPNDGALYIAADADRLGSIAGQAPCPVTSYGLGTADVVARDVVFTAEGARFRVERRGARVGDFAWSLPGKHNVENALAAIAFGLDQGLSAAELAAGLASFEGVARRQTLRGEIGGVRIIDDFAHHPTAVAATLEAIRGRWPDGRLVAVFEPRSATSARNYFQTAYAEAFDRADRVIIAGVGRPEIPAPERLDITRLAQEIGARGPAAGAIAAVDDIVRDLTEHAAPGDTLLIMSNGGFGGIFEKLSSALAQKFRGS